MGRKDWKQAKLRKEKERKAVEGREGGGGVIEEG